MLGPQIKMHIFGLEKTAANNDICFLFNLIFPGRYLILCDISHTVILAYIDKNYKKYLEGVHPHSTSASCRLRAHRS
jgi:hypothetical protein